MGTQAYPGIRRKVYVRLNGYGAGYLFSFFRMVDPQFGNGRLAPERSSWRSRPDWGFHILFDDLHLGLP